MELRSGIYKGVHGVLPVPHRAQFEDGVNLLFSSWTALCLAIDNEWGGPTSRQKAEQLYQDVLSWFYGHTGMHFSKAVLAGTQSARVLISLRCDNSATRRSLLFVLKAPHVVCMVSEHYADDLEVDLEACMLQDFNVELQDNSPRQVRGRCSFTCCLHSMLTEVSNLQISITLVSLHQECLQGNFSRIQHLKQHMNSSAQRLAKSQREAVRLLLHIQPVCSHLLQPVGCAHAFNKLFGY